MVNYGIPKRPNPAQYSASPLTDPYDRFASNNLSAAPAPPPGYYAYGEKGRDASRWNPRYWRKRTWAGVAVAAVVIIVAIAVGAAEGVKANRYPDYSTLDYTLTDTYSGTDFFDNFDYFDATDPSSGFVIYSDAATSSSMNLTYASSTSAVLRVDNTQTDATTGRLSARITSKTQYTSGLFLFDIVHTPYGCATWPAVWLSDPSNWPANGEIDVLEAVNQATDGNQMTLHTTDDCSMGVKRKQSGKSLTTNCYNGTDDNAGCGVQGAADTFGAALNQNGGGVYAMELRDAGIRMWFFARDAIPDDVSSGVSPNPESWGEALADFPSTDCDIATHFKNQSIIADIDVCGAWAGQTSVYSTEDSCPGICSEYAASNATAFDEAYWEFSYFKVYTASSATGT